MHCMKVHEDRDINVVSLKNILQLAALAASLIYCTDENHFLDMQFYTVDFL